MDKRIKEYAKESVSIIKEVIVNNELINGMFIESIKCDECGSTIIIRDVLNHETQYSLSEVSYVFTDYLDSIGDGNKNIYETVMSAKDNDNYKEYKDSFMRSMLRLKEIEQAV